MRIAIPGAAIEWVSELFDPRVFERGLAYAQQGRVNLVRRDWPVVAQVRGTEGYVVTVHYNPANHQARGDCSCPVGIDCKHAAAAALVAVADARGNAEARYQAIKQEAVGDWLATLGTDVADVRERPSDNLIAYVIARHQERLGISVHRTRQLKRGGFGASSVLSSLADPYRGAPSWVPVEDLRLIALLRAITHADHYQASMPIDRIDGSVWRELAGTGRLFWERVGTLPLAPGPARDGVLGWKEIDGSPGEYQIDLEGSLILLPAQECQYVDLASATIGPLEVGVPPSVAQRLVASPPVPESMLGTVRRSIRHLLDGDTTTALVGGGDEPEIETMRPRVFICMRGEYDDTSPIDGFWVSVESEAVYGDDRYELARWDPRRPAARNMVEEGRRLRRLDALLSELQYHGITGSGGTDEALTEARYIAHHVVPALREEGWECELADDFPIEPVATPTDWVEQLKPLTHSSDWFSFELGVVVAGRTVPLLPILLTAIREGELPLDPALLAADDIPGINLKLEDGELVHVSGERLKRWIRPLLELQLRGLTDEGELVVPSFTAVDIAEAGAGRFAHGELLAEIRARVEQLLNLEPRTEAATFAGQLRPYQREGLAWLRFLHDAGYGGLLADDMGLGKTVQVLAFLHELHREGTVAAGRSALVVAPRSVVGHWQSEASRFAADLAPVVHLGPGRAKKPATLSGAPMIITSYQTMLRDIELLGGIEWATVIFDEAQALKNPSTRLRRAATRLRAASRFGITGTPIENHLRELWSQMDLVMPGYLGRKSTFEGVFRRPIEKYGSTESLELLRQRIRPFMLRRTKASVDIDLPDKTEIVEQVDLGTSQRDLYESLRLSLDENVREALRDRGVQGSSLVVLDALLKLRQCCCDPRLIKTPQAQRVKSSAKLARLMSMLEELADNGRFVLVFSQFTSMLDIIAGECRTAKIPYLMLTGSTRNRDDVVRAFQNGEAPVFLISLKAGGTGLNLTRADTVIHYDPWWNPAVEDQATDRAHRIGQESHVFVYKLVARGTLEERIAELQRDKRALTDAALARGGITHLAESDLSALYHQLV